MLHASYAIGMLRHTMTEADATALRNAIRAARGDLSQREFSVRIGTDMMTLRNWELGRRFPKLYRHVVELEAAGVPIDLLRAGAAREVAA